MKETGQKVCSPYIIEKESSQVKKPLHPHPAWDQVNFTYSNKEIDITSKYSLVACDGIGTHLFEQHGSGCFHQQ